jgi:hypothetical protein
MDCLPAVLENCMGNNEVEGDRRGEIFAYSPDLFKPRHRLFIE